MRIDFNMSSKERGNFMVACEAVIRNVGSGTKAAVEHAALDIMSDSLGEVPVDTGTLISSAFAGVSRRTDVKNYRYGAVLGYGDIRGLAGVASLGPIEWLMEPTNDRNPKSNLPASAYAGTVHEDLEMPHPNGGKAKFLEDPVRNWASGKFARTAMTYWKRAIQYSNGGNVISPYSPRLGARRVKFIRGSYKIRRDAFKRVGDGVQRGGSTSYKGVSY